MDRVMLLFAGWTIWQLQGSMVSIGMGGRGASAMVGMVGDRVEWRK